MDKQGFAQRFRGQAFATWRHRQPKRPFFRIHSAIPGFAYVAIGPVALWRDGRRIGIGAR